MGGCCSSSRKLQLHGTPVYYYYQTASEEHPSGDGVSSVFSSGLLLDLNVNMSIPDTYRSPPAPLPYDFVLGNQFKEAKCTPHLGFLPPSPKKLELECLNPNSLPASATIDEEDACPTCLEEYDMDNPKIMTKCNHHFHLSCILEWMERSDTCPICDQEMIYESPLIKPTHD